jgi:branched-chain amino acid transport system ATP-binding protein
MPVLSTEDLTWRIGGVPIVDGVCLQLEAGEFVGVIGPNGAGKTSLFNLISGLNPAGGGRVQLLGADVTGLAPFQRARLGLGRTFQSSSVFGSLGVRENVALAAQARAGGSGSLWRKASGYEKADECLATVGLTARAGAKAGTLAHGEKRKLEIALLLAGDPKVLLLDEPMAGVSTEDIPGLVEVIRRVLGDGSGGQERSILMVEHHMDVILELAGRIAVMHHGSLLAVGTPDEVMANTAVQEAYLGEAL